VTSFSLTGAVVKKIVGVAAERKMPQLAAKSFRSQVKQSSGDKERVVLWADTWNNYYHPPTLKAAHEVLTAAGFDVVIPKKHLCCGRPLCDFGLLEQAKKYLLRVLDAMRGEIDAGTPFIFLEPSCASVFTDEMPEMLPNDERAKKMSKQIWLLADWLDAKAPEWTAERLKGKQVLIHGHCHHKASFGGPKSELALLKRSGADARMIEAGCCGMAGPFGFEADKYELSKTIAETALLPAVRGADASTLLVADGFSCREQIAQLSERKALHIAEVLALEEHE
jgi:Fe-S oxidoreductase